MCFVILDNGMLDGCLNVILWDNSCVVLCEVVEIF